MKYIFTKDIKINIDKQKEPFTNADFLFKNYPLLKCAYKYESLEKAIYRYFFNYTDNNKGIFRGTRYDKRRGWYMAIILDKLIQRFYSEYKIKHKKAFERLIRGLCYEQYYLINQEMLFEKLLCIYEHKNCS